MIEIIRKIITSILTALYQPFGFALIMTILFMGIYMQAIEKGWKRMIHCWIETFKTTASYRRIFLLVFYVSMILFRTLLNRFMWSNPVSNVIGVWGLYNTDGELTTEIIENLVLFVPFTILLLWCFRDKIIGHVVKVSKVLWQSVKIVFLFSLLIEFLQLFLRLGTFQLSDLFYNTLGGLIGGLIYWIGYRLTHKSVTE